MPLDIAPSLAAEIMHRARAAGISTDQLLDDLLHNQKTALQVQSASAQKTAWDIVKEIGFIEGPPDLSTNPKYMEGFGVGK